VIFTKINIINCYSYDLHCNYCNALELQQLLMFHWFLEEFMFLDQELDWVRMP